MTSVNSIQTDIADNEITRCRYEQINFIAHHVAQYLPELRKNSRFGDSLVKKIVRSEIATYLVSSLYNLRNNSQINEELESTDFIQNGMNQAVWLPQSDVWLNSLKGLIVESLFTVDKSSKRKRVVVLDGNVVSSDVLVKLNEFSFLDDIIRISLVAGLAEAGYKTFRDHQDVKVLRTLMPEAGSLRISDSLSDDEKKFSDFLVKQGADYNFSILFNFDKADARYNTKEEILLVLNEDKYTPLDTMIERIKHVRDYDRFKKCRVILLNLCNSDHQDMSQLPINGMQIDQNNNIEDFNITSPLFCSMLDFSTVSSTLAHHYDMKTIDSNPMAIN